MNNMSYTDYANIVTSSVDVENAQITIVKNGFIQGYCKTGAESGTPFIRLIINGLIVFEGHSFDHQWRYLWTPTFPVKVGDKVIYTITNDTNTGERVIREYYI